MSSHDQYNATPVLRLALATRALLAAAFIAVSSVAVGQAGYSADSSSSTSNDGESGSSGDPASSVPNAMYLSDNIVGGEVLLFPYFALSDGQTTTITVSNSANHVKAVKVTINEGLRGEEVFGVHLYLGPKDNFTMTLAADPNSYERGAVIHSDSTCTVPSFQDTWIPFFDYLIDEGTSDQIGPGARTLTGSVVMVEMGQWDPISTVKGAKAAAGAAGTETNACQALVEAWSQSFSEQPDKPWYSSWRDNPTDEAMSWHGGGLSGRATVGRQVFDGFNYQYETVVNYSPIVVADFARERRSAEYHQYPGGSSTADYPNPTLSAGALNFQPCTSISSDCGTTEAHQASSGLEALSSLMSVSRIGPLLNSQVADDSGVSWILSMPTKIFHTKSAAGLGPFASIWRSSNQPACDDVVVGTPAAAESSILLDPDTVSLCAAVNVLQLPQGNSTPLSTDSWLESTLSRPRSPDSIAISMAQKDPIKAKRDRRLEASIQFSSDTELVGLPVVAIPVYKNLFGQFDSAQFSSSVERVNKRVTISASTPSFPTANSANIITSVANNSGNALQSVSGVCQDSSSGEVITAESSTTEISFSALPPGSYECFAQASVARGDSERDYFSMTIGVPQRPNITDWETDDGVITLYFEDISTSQFSATSFKATCVSETGRSQTAEGGASPLRIEGLSIAETYTCTVSGENSSGMSDPSTPTTAITPQFSPSGLPFWLLYEANKQAGSQARHFK